MVINTLANTYIDYTQDYFKKSEIKKGDIFREESHFYVIVLGIIDGDIIHLHINVRDCYNYYSIKILSKSDFISFCSYDHVNEPNCYWLKYYKNDIETIEDTIVNYKNEIKFRKEELRSFKIMEVLL